MDVVDVLQNLERFGLVRLSKQRNDWYSMYCPFHSNGQEKKPSFGVLLHDQQRGSQMFPAGFCHCFTCSYANTLQGMIRDILRNHSISMSVDEWLAANVPGYVAELEGQELIPPELFKSVMASLAVKDLQQRVHSQQYIAESELASYRCVVPYMYERRLTDDIICRYDIGFDAKWVPPGKQKAVPCITFPVKDRDGHTLFLCRRSVQGKLYNYPEGVVKPLYGIDQLPSHCRSLIVCESCINALTCAVYGYNAVALMGTGNSYQIQQLKELGADEYVLCFDGDDAGRKATARMKRALSSVALVWQIDMPDGKDVNDCDKATFDNLYSTRY